jgi:hypothetical protein
MGLATIWAIFSKTHLVTLKSDLPTTIRPVLPEEPFGTEIMMKCCRAGMSDGLFSYQKSQFGYILEGLGVEDVGRHIL